MSFSDYLENKVLGYVFTGAAFTQPGTKYLGLLTAAPSDTGGGTEVSTSGTAYARQSVAFTLSGTSPTQVANTSQIDFPTATASWGTISHYGVYDAVSAGNLLSWGPLAASKAIGAGDVFRTPASTGVVITLD